MAEKEDCIARVKHLIGEAETERACRELLDFLENKPAYRSLQQDALEALAQCRRTAREDAKGLIDHQQARQRYARVHEQLLNLLERLDRDEPVPMRRRRLLPIAILLVVIALGAYFGARSWFTFDPEDLCPAPPFDPQQDFRAMLLPFRDYTARGAPDEEIPVSLQQFFRDFQASSPHVPLEVRVMSAHPWLVDDPNRFPPTEALAGELGHSCLANLIVWGTRENREAGGVIVRTSYRFLGFGDRFSFDKVKYRGQSRVDTVHAVSTISTQGVIAEELESSIRILYGIIAQRSDDPQAAIQALRPVHTTDSATVLTKEMFLANSYITMAQYDSAAVTYDRILAVHAEYGFALENRANLAMLSGDFLSAAELLSTRLQAEPPNTPELLRLRGMAYLRAGRRDDALQDLRRAREALPQDSSVQELLREAENL